MLRYSFLFFFFITFFVSAQPDSLYFKQESIPLAPIWMQKNILGVDINQVAFVNWNSGGSNSIAALLAFNSVLKYQYRYFTWDNNLVAKYGVNSQENQELRKTDDLLEIRSNLGYRKNKFTNWYYSSRFSFQTQFAKGYNYPNTDNVISKFMAPGYLFLGGGVEYGKNIEKLSTYFSPLTLKSTFVLDQALANAGSFGVTPAKYDSEGNLLSKGQRVRNELGILLTSAYEAEVFKNILIRNYMSFYTDYLNDFGNIDVDWQVVFDLKVNSFVRANIGSHLKYDNDVKILVEVENPESTDLEYIEEGARVQWKQLLGVGVVVEF